MDDWSLHHERCSSSRSSILTRHIRDLWGPAHGTRFASWGAVVAISRRSARRAHHEGARASAGARATAGQRTAAEPLSFLSSRLLRSVLWWSSVAVSSVRSSRDGSPFLVMYPNGLCSLMIPNGSLASWYAE
jgi:hypothetical protein